MINDLERGVPSLTRHSTFGGVPMVAVGDVEPGMVVVLGIDGRLEQVSRNSCSPQESIRLSGVPIIEMIRGAGVMVDVDDSRVLEWPNELGLVDLGDLTAATFRNNEDYISSIMNVVSKIVESGATPVVLASEIGSTGPAFWGFVQSLGKSDCKPGIISISSNLDAIFPRDYRKDMTTGRDVIDAIENKLVDPSAVVVVGVSGLQDYTQWKKARDSGVNILTGRIVKENGVKSTIDRTLDLLRGKADCLFVSIDIGAVDIGHAPGQGVVEIGGFDADEFLSLCRYLSKTPVKAVCLHGLVPELDLSGRSSALAAYSIIELIAPKTFVVGSTE